MMNRFYYRLLGLTLGLAFLLGACQKTTSPEEINSPEPVVVEPTSTATLQPTFTATETAMPTVTPTPQLTYPLQRGTPFPSITLTEINFQNAAELNLLAVYGKPVSIGISPLNLGDNNLLVTNVGGLKIYDRDSSSILYQMDVPIWYRSSWIKLNHDATGVAASADGDYFASIGTDRHFTIRDRMGTIVYELGLEGFGADDLWQSFSAAISPDGSQLAVHDCLQDFQDPYACKTRIVNWGTGEEIERINGNYPVYSPDGKYLVIWFDNKIQFYKTGDWSIAASYGIPGTGWTLNFSPSGEYFTLAGYDRVEVYRTDDFKLVRYIDNYTPNINTHPMIPAVRFSPDEDKLAVIVFTNGLYEYYKPPQFYLYDIAGSRLLAEKTLPELSGYFWLNSEDEIVSFVDPEYVSPYAQNTPTPDTFSDPEEKWIIYTFRTRNGLVSAPEGFADIDTGIGFSFYGKMGTRWITEQHFGERDLQVTVFDSVERKVIAERHLVQNALYKKFFPLENWNELGYIDESDCLGYLQLGEESYRPEICVPLQEYYLEGGIWDINGDEWTNSIASTDDGKLVIFGTSYGNLHFVNMETGETSMLSLMECPIDNVEVSEDRTLIAVYSMADGYTRIYGMAPIE